MTNKPFSPQTQGIDDVDRYLSQDQWLKVRDRLNYPYPARIAELRDHAEILAALDKLERLAASHGAHEAP